MSEAEAWRSVSSAARAAALRRLLAMVILRANAKAELPLVSFRLLGKTDEHSTEHKRV